MKFYITAAIPYVNAKPHVGHALEFVQGDVIARYHRLIGDNTTYLTGADENALKNVQAAEKEHLDIHAFTDRNSKAFQDMADALSVKLDVFQRSSSNDHHISSQKLWNLCNESGDIYKKTYKGLYCVGCEAFYTEDELNENGECFEHPGKKLEIIEEENYFFKLSSYKEKILSLIESNQLEIVPVSRKNEVISFLKGDVKDISISRSIERARNWGVPVPNDPSQIMYVWFDALNVYQSGVGFGIDEKTYDMTWPADIHLIGKGIIRFHAVYWPAILLSAKLNLPKKIYVHGYFTVNGQKMSKTLGNVIDPVDVIKTYGSEVLRYYFLREISTVSDGDFSTDRLKEVYVAHLQNGLGNMVSRIAKLTERIGKISHKVPHTFSSEVSDNIENFKLKEAMDFIWQSVSLLDKKITETKPWELKDEQLAPFLVEAIEQILQISYDLLPFMPNTSEKIQLHFEKDVIGAIEPLFPRIK